MTHLSASALLVALLLPALPGPAAANERHFATTYESPTLPAGSVEFEPWTTWRFGRERYYSRFDHRLEFELGLTDRLMTAFYVNVTGLTQNDGSGNLDRREFAYKGVSSEWKWNLRDPVADSFGLALYGGFGLAPHESEIEAKLIADKRMGNLVVAGNLVGELELVRAVAGTEVEIEKEYVVEVDAAVGYFLRPRLALGAELRNENVLVDGELLASVFFAGPTLAYGAQDYWLTLAVQPQIFAIHDGDGARELTGHEKLHVRLLLGFHL